MVLKKQLQILIGLIKNQVRLQYLNIYILSIANISLQKMLFSFLNMFHLNSLLVFTKKLQSKLQQENHLL